MKAKLVALVLATTLGMALTVQPAGAASGAAAVDGTGMFSPGLWITSPAQSVTLNFTIVGAFQPGAPVALASCSFSGYEVNSQATFTGGCSGTVLLNCSFDSSRLVLAWLWRGSCSINGGAAVDMTADLVIVPASANPIRSFVVMGELAAEASTN